MPQKLYYNADRKKLSVVSAVFSFFSPCGDIMTDSTDDDGPDDEKFVQNAADVALGEVIDEPAGRRRKGHKSYECGIGHGEGYNGCESTNECDDVNGGLISDQNTQSCGDTEEYHPPV